MEDRLAAPLAGLMLIVVGAAFIWSHVTSWRNRKHDASLDDGDRTFYYKQYRRRMQTSGMIVFLGIAIPLGDAFMPRDNPLLFGIFWLGLLMLTGWVILLGLGDFLQTRAHARVALARIRGKQLSLEKQIAELKSRNTNGHSSLN